MEGFRYARFNMFARLKSSRFLSLSLQVVDTSERSEKSVYLKSIAHESTIFEIKMRDYYIKRE